MRPSGCAVYPLLEMARFGKRKLCPTPRAYRRTRIPLLRSTDALSFNELADQVRAKLRAIDEAMKPAQLSTRIAELEKQLSAANVWETPHIGTSLAQERAELAGLVKLLTSLSVDLKTTEELHGMQSLSEFCVFFLLTQLYWLPPPPTILLLDLAAREQSPEVIQDCQVQVLDLLQQADQLWVQALLKEPIDRVDCYLEVVAGAGGKESCDWASMLLRMYERWAEKSMFQLSQESVTRDADSPGIHSGVLHIAGSFAFGKLKGEAGVHRLVRISPFDSQVSRSLSGFFQTL